MLIVLAFFRHRRRLLMHFNACLTLVPHLSLNIILQNRFDEWLKHIPQVLFFLWFTFIFFIRSHFLGFASQKVAFIKNGFNCCGSLKSGFALIAYYNSWHYNGFIVNENDAFFVHMKLRLFLFVVPHLLKWTITIAENRSEKFGLLMRKCSFRLIQMARGDFYQFIYCLSLHSNITIASIGTMKKRKKKNATLKIRSEFQS